MLARLLLATALILIAVTASAAQVPDAAEATAVEEPDTEQPSAGAAWRLTSVFAGELPLRVGFPILPIVAISMASPSFIIAIVEIIPLVGK